MSHTPILPTFQLMQAAVEQERCDDWGQQSFTEPLERLIDSLNSEAQLHSTGADFLNNYLKRLLCNRLKLQAEFNQHPEILQQDIQAPLIVVGLFRSGTTLLHNLLSQAPDGRHLSLAEALSPTPAPKPDTWKNDPRLEEVQDFIRQEMALTRGFSAAHHISADRPAECSRLFEYNFIAHLFDFRARIDSYANWLRQQDLKPYYQYYRQQLQYLSWRWPHSHWILKAPAHSFHLENLLDTFPEANIVYLKRDPVKVVSSCCSLAQIGRNRFSDLDNPHELGRYWLDVLAQGHQAAERVYQRVGAERIFQVDYSELMERPDTLVAKIHRYFDYPMPIKMLQKIEHYMQHNKQGKHGRHNYSLEQFALSAAEIRERF